MIRIFLSDIDKQERHLRFTVIRIVTTRIPLFLTIIHNRNPILNERPSHRIRDELSNTRHHQPKQKKIVNARRSDDQHQSVQLSNTNVSQSTTYRLILRDALDTRLIVVLDERPDVERAVVELALDLLGELGDDG